MGRRALNGWLVLRAEPPIGPACDVAVHPCHRVLDLHAIDDGAFRENRVARTALWVNVLLCPRRIYAVKLSLVRNHFDQAFQDDGVVAVAEVDDHPRRVRQVARFPRPLVRGELTLPTAKAGGFSA